VNAPANGPANRPVIGVDVGGTNMQIGLVTGDDAIIGRVAARTGADKGLDHIIENISAGIAGACRQAGRTIDDVAAVGIALAGAIDVPAGVVLFASNLGMTNVPLRRLLEERLGRPVFLDNDVNGAIWGEHRLGAGRGSGGDTLGVWVGTGVGGGLVIDGGIYRGPFCTAGEIGHTIATKFALDDGRPRWKIEDCCSRSGMGDVIARELDAYPGSVLNEIRNDLPRLGTESIASAYAQRDPLARRVVDAGADVLGVAIANLVTMLAVDTVIIGGGISEALGEPYLDRIRGSFDAVVFPDRCRECRLLMTTLAADAGLLGAALFAREIG